MLRIFNTLTKIKEKFCLSYEQIINIYVCGVTTYDLCHIGHARTFLVFDIIIRYLQHIGYKTNYVRNITDIDDKIIYRASSNNEEIKDFALRMTLEMKKDFSSLGLLDPNYEPKVTESIHDIIILIKKLINNNHAYIAKNGDVLFSILSYKKYGELSCRIKNDNNESSFDIYEKNIFFKDFVLWKVSTISEEKNNKLLGLGSSSWMSPWGLGRPGWHIECSAISYRYCANGIDIHGGGVDLLFPHHENESAQSFCINNTFPIRYWVHVGMVILNKKKVSKSLNNFITIRHLLSKYHPEVIRYYFLSSHYRHPFYYKEKNLISSQKILKRIYNTILLNNSMVLSSDKIIDKDNIINNFKKKFYCAMNDDFNTPKACSLLYKISRYINKIHKSNVILAQGLANYLVFFGNILGLLKINPKSFLFQNDLVNFNNIDTINGLINLRIYYRRTKQWHLADNIRKRLLKLGVVIEDKKNNSIYRKI